MSRGKKLTGQQRQAMESMRSRLKKVLPASERGYAAGIASGLVRTADPLVSDEDLDRILEDKCNGMQTPGLRVAVVETLLEPSGEQEGAYALRPRAEAKKEDADATASSASADGAAVPDAPAAGPDAPAASKKRAGTPFQKIPYVRRGDEDDAEARQGILALDQRIWVNGWLLSHPGAFRLYERELTAISGLLSGGAIPEGITRRQLAYRLGGNEKFFEYGSDGYKLLRAMGLEGIARHRHLPKTDVLYFAPRRRKRMRVLVTENLDPYLDIRDSMYEDGQSLFLGERVHAVVLGAGSPILERKRLTSVLETLGAEQLEVLYWGDIDRAGVDIFCRLREMLEGAGYNLRPFTPAYQLMVERAMGLYPDPADNEETGQSDIELGDYSALVDGLSEGQAAYVNELLDASRLVPQEILTRGDLVEKTEDLQN